MNPEQTQSAPIPEVPNPEVIRKTQEQESFKKTSEKQLSQLEMGMMDEEAKKIWPG